MPEEPLTRSVLASVLAELHAKLLAHIGPRLDGIELRLYEIEGRVEGRGRTSH